jgi:hypothetical protein
MFWYSTSYTAHNQHDIHDTTPCIKAPMYRTAPHHERRRDEAIPFSSRAMFLYDDYEDGIERKDLKVTEISCTYIWSATYALIMSIWMGG